jgi:hypothetical protein
MKNRDDFQDDGRVVADMSDLNDAGGFSFRKFKNKDICHSAECQDFLYGNKA